MHKYICLTLFSMICFCGLWAQVSNSVQNATTPLCVNLENELVSAYLKDANSAYSSGIGREGNSILNQETSGAEIAYYVSLIPEDSGSSAIWTEQPASVSVYTSTQACRVIVSETPSFQNYYSFEVSNGTASVINLIPQKIYWYRSLGASGETLDSGVFKTVGQVRMIATPNVFNVRDMGGWKCKGGRLAYGKIFRGGQLESASTTSPDYDILVNQLNIGYDFDLRHDGSNTVENGNTGVSPLGITYRWQEIMAYMALMTNTYAYQTHNAYSGYYRNLREMMDYMAQVIKASISDPSKGGAFYIHCAAGADRTGIICALFEALCGVSEEDIVKDWELTTFTNYYKFIDRQVTNWVLKNEAGEIVKEPAEMRRVFQYLYDEYGGKEGADLQAQVTKWFNDKVLEKKYRGAIQTIVDMLVEPDIKSPTLVAQRKPASFDVSQQYVVAFDEEKTCDAVENVALSATAAADVESELFSVTDYIDCLGYNYLLTNVVTKGTASFYNSSKKYIGSVGNASLDPETVLLVNDYQEFSVPDNAAYVRLSLPKYCDVSAILSVETYK